MSGSLWPVTCAWCGATAYKPVSAVNRAEKSGLRQFCNRACTGMARRDPDPLSLDQKRDAKAEYDHARRTALGEVLLAEKRAAYRAQVETNCDVLRAKQKALRGRRKGQHLEYIRRPEYRKWKTNYDRKHRAQKDYGPFAEAALILRDIETEVAVRATRTEIYTQNGTINKSIRRKRDYAKAVGC